MSLSIVTNEDNMEMMARYPDNFFELAIVDPPYGNTSGGKKAPSRIRERLGVANDNPPDEKYFNELFRVSKNQIIWGGNYFSNFLPAGRGWIFWDKKQPVKTYARGELAYTSFDINLKVFEMDFYGCHGLDVVKIHSTQKPIKLYKWILQNYAQNGDKILDTYLGSQSSRIASYDLGFDFYGCELDKEHFNQGCKRFDQHIKQLVLF